jgi:glutamate dehydrogenase/leucine dehydrogenase
MANVKNLKKDINYVLGDIIEAVYLFEISTTGKPTTETNALIDEAIAAFDVARILFSPGKASNAGGVATSGLEMSQNSLRLSWTTEEVDQRLFKIMSDIHESCVKYGTNEDGYVDYVKGANIAGFVKVADAMLAQGVV